MTGALHAMGDPGEPPPVPLNLVADYGGGAMFLALGMVSGLLGVRNGGEGQVVDAAMVDGVSNLLSLFHALMASGGWQDRRGVNLLDGGRPFYRNYECKDGGYVAVASLEPKFFLEMLDRLGIARDRFEQYDPACWSQMTEELSAIFRTRTRDEWAEIFEGSDACVSPILSMEEAMHHSANTERGVFFDIDGIWQAAPAPRFSSGMPKPVASRNAGWDDILSRWSV